MNNQIVSDELGNNIIELFTKDMQARRAASRKRALSFRWKTVQRQFHRISQALESLSADSVFVGINEQVDKLEQQINEINHKLNSAS